MKKKQDPYHKLLEFSKTISLQHSILSLLQWDQETYMPQKSLDFRALQTTFLSEQIHKQKIGKKFSKLLGSLVDIQTGKLQSPNFTNAQQAAIREWRREYLISTKLPSSFVKKFSNLTTIAGSVWCEAKTKNDFSLFQPYLKKIVQLSRKKADLLGYSHHPYNALLDLFEPEMTVDQLDVLFANLKTSLINLIQRIKHKSPRTCQILYEGNFDPQLQKNLGEQLLLAMGFSPDTSRLDLTSHPFCLSLHPSDIRMTTRIDKNNLFSNIFSVLHEGGHGLYGKGLPSHFYGSPLAESISLGIDESQSRWWETRIGHSQGFCRYLLP
ncbi:MAG: carboxypeptidase M32, partial [Leptospiraceae bacterium]|nr:carboxypeptidase M32 [Leptospiraceae bacterium]